MANPFADCISRLLLTNFRTSFEALCRIRRDLLRVEDVNPITFPNRQFPSADWSSEAASDRPAFCHRDHDVPEC